MNVSLSFPVWKLLAGPLVAFITCFCLTPPVRRFAVNVDAIDVPNERRINDHPIPRMGGLAIFCGFVLSVILFVDMDLQVIGLLLGCVTIAVFGALDDILGLNPWIKLGGQFLAAYVALRCGIVFDAISNPGFLDAGTTIQIGWLSVPVTILWIVLCTNAVNLIDGLDGLAVGVSAISSASMMLVSMIVPVSTGSVPLLLACLTGACLGFMPYNMNPAKIFMGDVGSQFLGYVLACVSIMGLFKFHAVITAAAGPGGSPGGYGLRFLPPDFPWAEPFSRGPRAHSPPSACHGHESEAGRGDAVRGFRRAGHHRGDDCRAGD